MAANSAWSEQMVDDACGAFTSQEYGKTTLLCSQVLEREPTQATAHLLLGLTAFASGQPPAARNHIQAALEQSSLPEAWIEPAQVAIEAIDNLQLDLALLAQLRTYHTGRRDLLTRCLHRLEKKGALAQARETYEQLLREDPSDGESQQHYWRLAREALVYHQPQPTVGAKARNHPLSILSVGQSGSASLAVAREVCTALGMSFVPGILAGDSHDNHLVRERLQMLVEQGGIAAGHIYPRLENLIAIECSGLDRVWVHVRDPRQSALSMLHWWNTEYRGYRDREAFRYNVLLLESFFRPGFFERPLSEQLDEIIETYLPIAVSFASGWLAASRASRWRFAVHFTRFDDFKLNRQSLFRSVLDFYRVGYTFFPFPEREPSPEGPWKPVVSTDYFRAGKRDEFRQVYSPQQLARANAAVPDDLLAAFGWER